MNAMGNREDLLAGARRCLYEKGYARTTARDIAAAAGTSLAAIGYHFRSTEALLNAAMLEALGDWGNELGRELTAEVDPSARLLDRFEATWTRAIAAFEGLRPVLIASVEAVAQAERVPEVRAQLAAGLDEGRFGLAALFQDLDPQRDKRQAWQVGSFYQALMSGIVVQWLVDPQHAPTGRDLATALRSILAHFGQTTQAAEPPCAT
jgi:AcrR family transcriptional regulator